eukprot:354691-Chlamydomonas_euryale.AAC.22
MAAAVPTPAGAAPPCDLDKTICALTPVQPALSQRKPNTQEVGDRARNETELHERESNVLKVWVVWIVNAWGVRVGHARRMARVVVDCRGLSRMHCTGSLTPFISQGNPGTKQNDCVCCFFTPCPLHAQAALKKAEADRDGRTASLKDVTATLLTKREAELADVKKRLQLAKAEAGHAKAQSKVSNATPDHSYWCQKREIGRRGRSRARSALLCTLPESNEQRKN